MKQEQIDSLTNAVTIFLDFESSGLHPDSYPIEIGIVYGDKVYSNFIKPVRYWTHWDHNAQDIHNIERDTILNEGIDVVTIANELNDLFSKKTLWADANEDTFWMDTLFEAANVDRKFTVGNVRNIIPEKYHELFKKETSGVRTHRALEDAQDLKCSWLSFLKKL